MKQVQFLFTGEYDEKNKTISLKPDLEIYINNNMLGYFKIKKFGLATMLNEVKKYLP